MQFLCTTIIPFPCSYLIFCSLLYHETHACLFPLLCILFVSFLNISEHYYCSLTFTQFPITCFVCWNSNFFPSVIWGCFMLFYNHSDFLVQALCSIWPCGAHHVCGCGIYTNCFLLSNYYESDYLLIYYHNYSVEFLDEVQ
jgi:hypothetical protein